MAAMMIDNGKRVAAAGTRLEWHMIPIADIELIARNTDFGTRWLLDRVDNVGADLFVALQL